MNKSEGCDFKSIVIGARTLYVFNTQAKRPDNDNIYSIDLHTLERWRKIPLRAENRPNEFSHFGIVPFASPHKPVLMFGGHQNACL